MREKMFFSARKTGVTLWAVAFLLFFYSCGQKAGNCPPIEIHRYEKALMQLNTADLQEGLKGIAPEFPLFFEGADMEDTLGIQQIRLFIEDPVVQELYGKIRQTYDNADSSHLAKEMGCLFERAGRMDTDFHCPDVYTYISYIDYNHRVLCLDSFLVIALDLYVDDNEALLEEAGIPRYLSARLNSRHLMPDIARAIAMQMLDDPTSDDLLSWIVYEGKILWFARQILPAQKASVLLGYSEEDFTWCKRNESSIWQYIVQQGLLFETNPFEYRYFVNDGPFNPLLPGAPARLAAFVGWKMVEAYMKNSGKDWAGLKQADAKEILNHSKYKPS